MLFYSKIFFLFFILYFMLHWLVPIRFRLGLIIIGSTIFYGYWNPYYVWVPFALMIVAYVGTNGLAPVEGQRRSRIRLILWVTGLLLPLIFFKYTNFIYRDVVGPLVGWQGQLIDLGLPLGISFVTFTMLAYLVDVYHGKYPLERRLSMVTGYSLFYPHLIAGPILRPHELIPQLDHQPPVRNADFTFGFFLFTVGMVKKLIFADNLGDLVDPVYADVLGLSGWDYLVAIYGFSVQIYCDFSGYTDMALGTAFILGVTLPDNFERPYISASIREFWQRWHITLSHWLRDYLYIPLGGNRKGLPRQVLNILITMGLCGLWHGANWTFIVWGLVHGLAAITTHLARRFWNAALLMPRWLAVLLTFHFVTVAWVLFRSPDLATVQRLITGPFTASYIPASEYLSKNSFPLALMGIFFLTHFLDDHDHFRALIRRLPKFMVWTFAVFFFILALVIGSGNTGKFIYFDF